MVESSAFTRPETLREVVEDFLRDAIMNGRFLPGQRLVERELCEQLKVSRPPLREALRRLEAEKLIVRLGNRGPVVASVNAQEARELYALRGLLEGYAAQQFALEATDDQIGLLGEKVNDLRSFLDQPDRARMLAVKAQFYEVLLDGAGNRMIGEILNGLLTRINLLRAMSFSRPQRFTESLKEIEALYTAIQRRDPEEARRLATLHIRNAEAAALTMVEQADM